MSIKRRVGKVLFRSCLAKRVNMIRKYYNHTLQTNQVTVPFWNINVWPEHKRTFKFIDRLALHLECSLV